MDKKITKVLKQGKLNFFLSKKDERIIMFAKYGIDIISLLEKIEIIHKINYIKFGKINYFFYALEITIKICHFLKEEEKNGEDVDKIIITHYISLAESIYNSFYSPKINKKQIIESFFCRVKNQLEYNISGHIGSLPPYKKTFDSIETLYGIRNAYIHQQDFLGKFFSTNNIKNINLFIGESGETMFSECRLTYNEFISIFLSAFISNIENYIK